MVQLPQDLDPGEAIAAVVGIRPLLTKKFERISADQWERIGKLDKTIYKLARDLAREQLDRTTFTPIDYDQYLTALSTDIDPAQIESIVAQFPIAFHDATTAYLGQVAKTLRFLRGKFPISTFKTLFGTQNLPPSETDIFAFEDLLEVVDNPMSVFEMVDSGRLTSDIALALMQISPSIYDKVVGDIVVRCSTEKAATDNFEPHFEQALSVLLAVPGVNPTLRQQLQAPPPQQPQPQQPQQAPEPSSNTQASRLAPTSDKPDFND
jgi:hypothetical protein